MTTLDESDFASLEIGRVPSSLVDALATVLAPVLVAALIAVSFLLGWHVRPDAPPRAIVVEVESTTTSAP